MLENKEHTLKSVSGCRYVSQITRYCDQIWYIQLQCQWYIGL